MSYSIALRIYQTNPDRGYFRIVEQTVWHFANGGTWSCDDGVISLTMGGSGTSGVVRFMSDKGERIAVAIGVHNYERWCDVVPNLAPDLTALVLNGQYYNNGGRDSVREKQLALYSATSATGTKVEIKYTVAQGNKLEANIIFG